MPDETRIRHLIQQVKRADQESVPPFDDVLRREPKLRKVRSTRRMRLAIAGLAAIVLIAVVWRAIPDGADRAERRVVQGDVSAPPGDPARRGHVADLDFDYLQTLVDEHLGSPDEARGDAMPVWSSETDSLLALDLELDGGDPPLPPWLFPPGEGSELDSLPDGEGA